MNLIKDYSLLLGEIERSMEVPFRTKEHRNPASSPRIYKFANDPDERGWWLGRSYDLEDAEIDARRERGEEE